MQTASSQAGTRRGHGDGGGRGSVAPVDGEPVIELRGALAGEHLARLRDARTPPASFRRAAGALATLVLAEALRDIAATEDTVRTPLAEARAVHLARRVTLVPVLRAGLALLEPALRLLPEDTRVGFLGLRRDEATLEAAAYAERLPPDLAEDDVVVLEVMIATGGSAVAALDVLSAAGARELRLVGLVAAPEGIQRVAATHPEVPITVAAIDDRLDERGFIVPGLGDAGDRLYGESGG
ncbi:MAG TPA: uracil phosphoribosyltransferase [Miltoncostaeaceae bacterium]|nr:uracil phosphoribosyltransferase [Miltoncostaeaceae bacterium]